MRKYLSLQYSSTCTINVNEQRRWFESTLSNNNFVLSFIPPLWYPELKEKWLLGSLKTESCQIERTMWHDFLKKQQTKQRSNLWLVGRHKSFPNKPNKSQLWFPVTSYTVRACMNLRDVMEKSPAGVKNIIMPIYHYNWTCEFKHGVNLIELNLQTCGLLV